MSKIGRRYTLFEMSQGHRCVKIKGIKSMRIRSDPERAQCTDIDQVCSRYEAAEKKEMKPNVQSWKCASK